MRYVLWYISTRSILFCSMELFKNFVFRAQFRKKVLHNFLYFLALTTICSPIYVFSVLPYFLPPLQFLPPTLHTQEPHRLNPSCILNETEQWHALRVTITTICSVADTVQPGCFPKQAELQIIVWWTSGVTRGSVAYHWRLNEQPPVRCKQSISIA